MVEIEGILRHCQHVLSGTSAKQNVYKLAVVNLRHYNRYPALGRNGSIIETEEVRIALDSLRKVLLDNTYPFPQLSLEYEYEYLGKSYCKL